MAISWYNRSYCTVLSDLVLGDCHVRTSSFFAMTVVVDTWLHISEKLVKCRAVSTTSCGHPKRLPVFFVSLLTFFVVPGKNLWYNDSK